MAMHVSGPLVVGGATLTGSSGGMQLKGPVAFSQGNYVIVHMDKYRGDFYRTGAIAAISGARVAAWETVLPPFALRLDRVAMTFGRGSAPDGAEMRLKVWSNGARKGLFEVGVGAATTRAAMSGALSFTFPASAVLRFTIESVSGTVTGGGGEPTLYMRHWS